MLKASIAAEEVRYRRAVERTSSAGAKNQEAANRVQAATESVWREVVRRKVEGADNLRGSVLRDRVVEGAGDALKRLGREIRQYEQISRGLAHDSMVVASLHRVLADRTAALKRFERREVIRHENQEHEELAEVATVATLRCDQGVWGAALAQGPLDLEYKSIQSHGLEPVQRSHAGSVLSVSPRGHKEETLEIGRSIVADDASGQHLGVRLTLPDPTHGALTASVEVIADRTGAIAAEVILASSTLRERVAEHKAQIARRLAELDLPIASLVVSHGDPLGDGVRQRVGRRVGRKKQESDDEVCVA